MITAFLLRSLDRKIVIAIALLLAGRGAGAGPEPADGRPSNPLHIPTYVMSLFGKYLTYALLALALDLVWGFCGILSLGHGAFFALGGYAMGMYLMRQIGTRGVYGNPDSARLHGVPELEGTALVLVSASTISGSRR